MTTLVFAGNRYKYEMENVAKLFFPLAHFHFDYEGRCPAADYILFAKEDRPEGVCLSVRADLPGYRAESENTLPAGTPDNLCEEELARQLYRLLEAHTGIHPQWGILTGVRPVKLVQKRLLEGKTDEEVRAELKSRDLVSDHKLDLALKVAHVQAPILSGIRPRDYSLYLSIPYCPSRCSYCSFVSQSVTGKKAVELLPKYLMALIKELRETARLAERQGMRLRSVYLGGGTPTVLSASQLRQLTGAVRQYFPGIGAVEYTIEAGRPDTITPEKLEVIKESGATRISINPQTFSDEVLMRIGRKHTARDTADCFHMAREMGFDDINMDLIAGLPGDSYEGFCRSLLTARDLSPENITVHSLTVKRSSALYAGLGEMEDYRPVQKMMDFAAGTLMAAGYDPYYLYRQKNTVGNLENVGYARPGHWGEYNIYITEEAQSILACGAGAVSKAVLPGKIERVYNFKYPYEYIGQFQDILERKGELEEKLSLLPAAERRRYETEQDL